MARESAAGRARAGGVVLAALAIILFVTGFALAGRPAPKNPELALAPSLRPVDPSPSPTPRPFLVIPRQSLLPTPYIPEVIPTPDPTEPPDVAKGPTNRVATRVVVPELGIDLPVMRQKASYPECDVAMYLPRFRQPGQGGPVYLYAHAQRGMFLELLEQSLVRDGRAMIGMQIHVYTGDNYRFRYEITRVRRHARDFGAVLATRGETVWLQTSEGPNASYPKLQVGAELVGRKQVGHAEAHPKPRPRSC